MGCKSADSAPKTLPDSCKTDVFPAILQLAGVPKSQAPTPKDTRTYARRYPNLRPKVREPMP